MWAGEGEGERGVAGVGDAKKVAAKAAKVPTRRKGRATERGSFLTPGVAMVDWDMRVV